MNNDIIQTLLLVLSAAAIALVMHGGKRVKLAGCTVGLLAQPFWLVSAWQSNAWGILILTLWYTGVYFTGAVGAWKLKEKL